MLQYMFSKYSTVCVHWSLMPHPCILLIEQNQQIKQILVPYKINLQIMFVVFCEFEQILQELQEELQTQTTDGQG